MLQQGMPYSAADWQVRAGREAEFVRAWNDFIRWTVEEVPGARTFHLLRDEQNSGRFVSFGSWDSMETVQAWGRHERFAEMYGRCVELCDDVTSGPFTLEAGMRSERRS
jgi:heme-degrading monooxygenase HmoA